MIFAKNHKGITLIEVLIATLIIGVGLIGILTAVLYSLSLLDRVKAETIGTSLAKQGIELIFSLRDTNLKRGIGWDCISFDLTYSCNKLFGDLEGKYLQIALNWSGEETIDLYTGKSIYFIKIVNDSGFNNNRLFLKTGNVDGYKISFYNYLTGKQTFFSRIIYFTGFYSEPDGGIVDKSKLLKVVSKVEFKKGFYKKDFILESIIGDIY